MAHGSPLGAALMRTAHQYMAAGLRREAAQACRQALADNPLELDALRLLADLAAQDTTAARRRLAGDLVRAGQPLLEQQPAAAEGFFRVLWEHYPGVPAFGEGLVMALYRQGRLEEARVVGARVLAAKDTASLAARPRLRLNPRPRPPRDGRDVVAFSLWGDDPSYLYGALDNARLARDLWLGWSVRIYHDASVPASFLARLAEAGAELVAVDDTEAPAVARGLPGAFWRFLVADDPGVRRFLVRDVDSRPGRREIEAVTEWLGSDRPFHVMRDHPIHAEVMLAGLWGGVGGHLSGVGAVLHDLWRTRTDHGADQEFLGQEVWPLIRDQVMVHDSAFALPGSRPFPTPPPPGWSPHVGEGYKVQAKKTPGVAEKADGEEGV